MNLRHTLLLGAALAATACTVAVAQDRGPDERPRRARSTERTGDAERVRPADDPAVKAWATDLAGRLGGENRAVARSVAAALRALGPAALPALGKAAGSDDATTARRAMALIAAIHRPHVRGDRGMRGPGGGRGMPGPGMQGPGGGRGMGGPGMQGPGGGGRGMRGPGMRGPGGGGRGMPGPGMQGPGGGGRGMRGPGMRGPGGGGRGMPGPGMRGPDGGERQGPGPGRGHRGPPPPEPGGDDE